MDTTLFAEQNVASEWAFASARAYADPFNEIELNVLVRGPGGEEWLVPAFWAGGREWRVRCAPPTPGGYRFRSRCSDESNSGLHGVEGAIEAAPYAGDNELLRRGPLRLSDDRRFLQHRDGSPFLWFGDTWWMGLSKRLAWPDEFQMLAAERKAQGFSLIQIVAGPYPDMPAFDPRNENEAGQPWEAGFARVNPAYYDMADLRLRWLVRTGLVPCILGCWGYYLPTMGLEKMKRHWRHLVARYGAYPVVWCLAGEGAMPFYLSQDRQGDAAAQIDGWTEVARYLRAIDPYHHPITIHPTDSARNQVRDDAVLDFDMLQTGHGGYPDMTRAAQRVMAAVARPPRMPVVNGEACYEGILGGSGPQVQRFIWWSNMLSGAAGYTYGANGVWQLNRPGAPYGPSPHGFSWGDTPWIEAGRLPGGRQMALGKRLLERYPWWRFQPRQDWVSPAASPEEPNKPYAAGIPGEVRVLYLTPYVAPWTPPVHVRGLEAGVTYRGLFVDPISGAEHPVGEVRGDAEGNWRLANPPLIQDWVLVLERA